MELNVRKSRIRNRCPRMKRVPGRGRFTFRCHRATNKEREREREGQEEKYQHKSNSIR